MNSALSRNSKRASIRTALDVLHVYWPAFVEIEGCVFAAFQCGEGPVNLLSDGRTETECFINHTHIFDEFRNRATAVRKEAATDDLDVIEEMYDAAHPDFVAACEIGREMARMWATKLKGEFPEKRFRVYYTQYDNPVVRFHVVRDDEPVWLSDEQLESATDPTFDGAVIYDTRKIENPTVNRNARPE